MVRSLRSLAKSPGYFLTAVVTLALGVGVNTAIFSVVRSVLLAPLPFPDADRLVAVQSANAERKVVRQALTPSGYRALQTAASFEGLAAWRYETTNLTGIERPAQLSGAVVTLGYFDLLGARPSIGRGFAPADAEPGAAPVVVLSHRLWETQFNARRDIVGRSVLFDDQPHTVVGVMPAAFNEYINDAALWRLIPREDPEYLEERWRNWNILARLASDATPASVRAELSVIAGRLAQADAATHAGWSLHAVPLRELMVGDYRRGLTLVFAAAALVLLLTCANLGGLMLVRSVGREREFAVRLAIGANRGALVRAELAETLVIVAGGGVLGLLVGSWGLDLLRAGSARNWLPPGAVIAMDVPVLAIMGLVALAAGLAFGLLPAFRAARINAAAALRAGAKGSAGPQAHRARRVLVVAQLAVTLVLLVCAGTAARSFATILRENPGIQVQGAISMLVPASRTRFATPESQARYFRSLVERVRQTPGVEDAAVTQTVPFTWGNVANFSVAGREDERFPAAYYDSVSPTFFSTLRIPLIAGRTFAPADVESAPRVVVLSQAAAAQYFPNIDPIGQRLLLAGEIGYDGPGLASLEVIGIVGDVRRRGLAAPAPPQVYASFDQRGVFYASLVARSSLPVETLAQPIQKAIWSVNPDQPVQEVVPFSSLVLSLSLRRLYLVLFSLFAVLALVLAAVGLYGLVAHGVAQRTREFGIRVALGAQPRDLTRLVLREGLRLAALGAVVGLAGVFASRGALRALLYRTAPADPFVIAAVLALLTLIALFACWWPARRAGRTDPLIALKAE